MENSHPDCFGKTTPKVTKMPKAIQENNKIYNLLSPLVQFGTRCHYNRFDVHGLENLPAEGAYIIAPCHQQCLMEPLAVLCFAPKPPVFLARADIFARASIRAILTFLKILPVYRIRDGQSNLSKNNTTFDASRKVLLDGFPLCLMAEGRHNNRHHLLKMGKGMFRIAGETQMKMGRSPLYIVPTGIDFDDYERPYSNLVVNIGTPIPVQPFMDDYRNNEPLALNRMRDALTNALSSLMHDIRDEDHYDEIMTLCHVLNREMRHREGLHNSPWNRFLMRQRISLEMDRLAAENTEGKFLSLVKKSGFLIDQCRRLHLPQRLLSEHWTLAGTLLALSFIVAFAAAVMWVPFLRWIVCFCLLCYPLLVLPTHLVVKPLIADPQFRSSINFGVRFFLSILYALVIGVVMACCQGGWMGRLADIGAWWGVAAVAMVPIEAALAGPLTVFFRNLFSNLHYWLLRLFRHRTMRGIKDICHSLEKSF